MMIACVNRPRRSPLAVFVAVCIAGLAQAAAAQEPGAHVHGVAELRVVVDGTQLEVALESPLDNLLGFEHAPRTEPQRAAVRAMTAKLRRAQGLFTPSAAARCAIASVELASSALPASLLGQAGPAAAASEAAPDGHADLDATYTWHCDAPAQLKGLDVGLMQAFPGIRQLDVQVVGPKGQSAARLSAAKRSLQW
jgi:hypothetical protein